MFKAIGKWGSHVKARIKIPFLSNLFSSKSNDYSGMHDDEEEIFSDAREELDDLSDTETPDVVKTSIVNGHLTVPGQSVTVSNHRSSGDKGSDGSSVDTSVLTSNEDLVDVSVHRSKDIGSSQSEKSEHSEHSDGDDDHHHISHSDKKKMIKSDSKADGMTKSSSTSTFKKVHRRISSLTHKQYGKLDKDTNNEAKVCETTDGTKIDTTENKENSKSDSKANGMPKSPSTSKFKKVHRRISSLTHKQYGKIDKDTNTEAVHKDMEAPVDTKIETTENKENSKLDSKANGMPKSPSTSTFKKVHRRISSLTQKQYSKFDNSENGDTEQILSDAPDGTETEGTEITENGTPDTKPNGMPKSPSTSTFKKVHRRISSLTQKPYTKFDNNQNGDTEAIFCDASDSTELDSTETVEDSKTDSKPDSKSDNKSDSKANDMPKSPSTSTFKKVHKRISSLTQKQYSKFDNSASGDTEQIICDAPDDTDHEDPDITEDKPKEKKPSRRKKVAKRARRSIRGSWKWMKRGMLGYAQTFNTPTFFVLNFSGAAASKRY